MASLKLKNLPWLDLPLQKKLVSGSTGKILLMLGILSIGFWQLHFRSLVKQGALPAQNYSIDNTGIIPPLRAFTYFYYYLGLYPLSNSVKPTVFGRQGAEDLIQQHGSTLIMEESNSIRWGDHGRIWLYWLEAVRKGRYREDLSLLPSQQVFWTLSLILLWSVCWWLHVPVLGLFLVIFLGSNPLSIHELYVRENAFGLPGAIAVFVLALHFPWIIKTKESLPFYLLAGVAIITAVLLGTVRQIRLENALIAISALTLYTFLRSYSKRQRVVVVGLFLLMFGLTMKGWEAYFERKFNQATDVVKAHGGVPYNGPVDRYHMFWHPIWCGLGDFDRKYGYVWSDNEGARFAEPFLKKYIEEHPDEFPEEEGVCHDKDCRYVRTIFDFNQYRTIIRDKVLHDIRKDPLWYAGILARRAKRILFESTPVRASIGSGVLTLPYHGLMLPFLMGFLIYVRKWRWLGWVLFTRPLALPAFAVFSGRGNVYLPIFPQITAALLCAWIVEAVWAWRKHERSKR
jgi:hypothetical protein